MASREVVVQQEQLVLRDHLDSVECRVTLVSLDLMVQRVPLDQ